MHSEAPTEVHALNTVAALPEVAGLVAAAGLQFVAEEILKKLMKLVH